MLRREAANIRALADGIDRRHARAPSPQQVRAQHRAEALREAIDHMPGFDGAKTAKEWLRAFAATMELRTSEAADVERQDFTSRDLADVCDADDKERAK